MDTAAPPPPNPWQERPAYHYAATEIGPRKGREAELCDEAATADWLYIGVMGAGVVGSAFADLAFFKGYPRDHDPGKPYDAPLGDSVVRTIGPGAFGLFWGGLLGGGYLSLPKCSRTWVDSPPVEGEVRTTLPLAIAIATLSAATAPMIVASYTGPIKNDWPVSERWARHIVPFGTGFIGALVPYLLPPRTWAAKKELDRIRFQGDVMGGLGGTVSYTVAF